MFPILNRWNAEIETLQRTKVAQSGMFVVVSWAAVIILRGPRGEDWGARKKKILKNFGRRTEISSWLIIFYQK